MARLAGVTIPDEKKVEVALTYVFGVGRVIAGRAVKEAKISPHKRAKELTGEELIKLRNILEKEYKVEGALRREITMNIKRLRDIGSYRGMRHSRSLPVRGQRTKTNSRTRHGNVRKTMGSGKRKIDKK